jgi:hypothetical protein
MRGGGEASVRRRLLTGGIARVGTARTPRATWVLVEGDRIAAVGDEGEPGAAPPVRQRWVSPGDVADLPGEKYPRWERVRCSGDRSPEAGAGKGAGRAGPDSEPLT